MLFLSIGEVVLMAIRKAIRALFLSLCEIIFKLIVFFYNIFERFGTASIMNNTTVNEIYQRVGLILGLIMIFRVSFYFIQYVINPDLIADKNIGVGNIIKRVVIVIVLLGITPFLFREAYSLQSFLVEQNIVGKVISGKKVSNYAESTGQELAWYAFSSFYRPIDQSEIASYEGNISCVVLDGTVFETDFYVNHSLKYGYNCLNNTVDVIYRGSSTESEEFIIDFDGNGLVPAVVGLLILWLIVMYTIQLGVRLLQLAYLQLIAPIPIIMYLNPKSDSLQKWSKQCLTTFVDYFIRSAIMYFVVFIIRLILDVNDSSTFMSAFEGISLGTFGKYYIKLIIIIALLIFAKRVPKLLEDIFPVLKNAASLDFGLKMPKEMKQVGGAIAGATAAGAIGLIGGGPGLGNKLKGLAGGVTKGGVSGFKGNKLKDIASARAKQNVTNRQNREQGNTLGTRIGAKMRETFGFDNEGYADISKMQYQWNSGKSIEENMNTRGIEKLSVKRNENGEYETSNEQFAALGFHQEWVDAARNKEERKVAVDNATKELTLAQAAVTSASSFEERAAAEERYKVAYKSLSDAQGALETADKIKSAMDKKYSGDAQRFSNYKFYTNNKNDSAFTSNGDNRTRPVNVNNNDVNHNNDDEQSRTNPVTRGLADSHADEYNNSPRERNGNNNPTNEQLTDLEKLAYTLRSVGEDEAIMQLMKTEPTLSKEKARSLLEKARKR